jgi:acyl transferase domain-containing protein/NAD(P)-dependent dehydrogenase (short-subunit alcohol dehydrogenase family)/acyl carrier protein
LLFLFFLFSNYFAFFSSYFFLVDRSSPSSVSSNLGPTLFSRVYLRNKVFSDFPWSSTNSLVPVSDSRSSSSSSPSGYVLPGVFLITGGLGTLGLVSASTLLDSGYRRIALCSRSGKTATPADQELYETLLAKAEEKSAMIRVFCCDVSEEESLRGLFRSIESELCDRDNDLVGIIHSAGVLRDGLLVSGKAEAGAELVWETKVKSCELLFRLACEAGTGRSGLKHFINFSSLASAVGNVGQCSYAAANRAMESVVGFPSSSHRNHCEFQCVNIRWPGIIGSGMGKVFDPALHPIMMTQDQVREFLSHLLAPAHWTALLSRHSAITLTPLPSFLLEKNKTSWKRGLFDCSSPPRDFFPRPKPLIPAPVSVSVSVNPVDSVVCDKERENCCSSSSCSSASPLTTPSSPSPSSAAFITSDGEEEEAEMEEEDHSDKDSENKRQENDMKEESLINNNDHDILSVEGISVKIKELIAGLLGIDNNQEDDQLDEDLPLMTLGLDSITAAELSLELSLLFHEDFPATFLYSYPTIRSMAETIFHEKNNKKNKKEKGKEEKEEVNKMESLFHCEKNKKQKEQRGDEKQQNHKEEEQLDSPRLSTPRSLSSSPSSTSCSSFSQRGKGLEEVSIIGLAMDFPGDITSLPDLFRCLAGKESKLTELSETEVEHFLSSVMNKTTTDATDNGDDNSSLLDSLKRKLSFGHFLSIQQKDPSLVIPEEQLGQFKLTPSEYEQMDLSQKLLLRNVRRALEDCGQLRAKTGAARTMTVLNKNTGVFVGIGGVSPSSSSSSSSHSSNNHTKNHSDNATTNSSNNSINTTTTPPHSLPHLSPYSATANTISVAAGRISFSFGLEGPCLAVDTACSSSLVALHSARRALQLHECDLAIVAGVHLIDSGLSLACAVAGMISSDGKSRSFDSSADGYGRGEGCGVLILKRSSDCEKDGTPVYATVRGSAVSQDGSSASLTAPNGLAQESVIKRALRDAGEGTLSPRDIQFIESHGTGTQFGDTVEIAALVRVFGNNEEGEEKGVKNNEQSRSSPHSHSHSQSFPLFVTGVKANIGHLEAASGLAGIFATILSLQEEMVFGNANLRELNPLIRETLHKNEKNNKIFKDDDNQRRTSARRTLVISSEALPLHAMVSSEDSLILNCNSDTDSDVCSSSSSSTANKSVLVGGVSSFGYSGTIAHVILSQPIRRNDRRETATSVGKTRRERSGGLLTRESVTVSSSSCTVSTATTGVIERSGGGMAEDFAKNFFGIGTITTSTTTSASNSPFSSPCSTCSNNSALTDSEGEINKSNNDNDRKKKPALFPLLGSSSGAEEKNNKNIKSTITTISRSSLTTSSLLHSSSSPSHSSAPLPSVPPTHPTLVFQFSGQGGLAINACRSFYEKDEHYRHSLKRCDEIVRPLLLLGTTGSGRVSSLPVLPRGVGVIDLLYPELSEGRLSVRKAEELLSLTRFSQVVLVALQVSLAAALVAQGIRPAAVTGHSLGEYSAAIIAGLISLEDALTMAAERGRIIEEENRCRGKMVAIRHENPSQLINTAIPARLRSQVAVAAVNGPQSVILSGEEKAVDQLLVDLKITAAIPLKVKHAFHSPLLKAVVPSFRDTLKSRVTFTPEKWIAGGVRYFSTYLGREVSRSSEGVEEVTSLDYWTGHLIERVRYLDTVESLYNQEFRYFVEIGPDKVLMKLSQPILKTLSQQATNKMKNQYSSNPNSPSKGEEFTTIACVE